jgi:hypothetical protein
MAETTLTLLVFILESHGKGFLFDLSPDHSESTNDQLDVVGRDFSQADDVVL